MTSIAESAPDAADKPRGRRSPAQHGTRLPEDWVRSPADIAWQRKEGIPDTFARPTTDTFKNYWWAKPGSAAKKLDWSLTWRVWIMRDWMKLPEFRRAEYKRDQLQRDQQRPGGRVPEAWAR